MGTDIHVLTERKHDGKWINCDNWRLNPYFGEDQSELMYDLNPVYWKRNYDLFAVLANVRNDGGTIPFICEPRGLPDDISRKSEEYISLLIGDDGHSHSFFTVKELWKHWKEVDPKIQEERVFLMTDEEVGLYEETGFFAIGANEQVKRMIDSPESYTRKKVVETIYPMDSFMVSLLRHFVDVMCLTPIDEKATVKEIRWNKTLESEVNSFGNEFRVVFFFDN